MLENMIKNEEKKEEESKEVKNEENKIIEEKKEDICLNNDNFKELNSIITNNNEINKEEKDNTIIENKNNENNIININSDIKESKNNDNYNLDFNIQNDNIKDNFNTIIFNPNTINCNEKFNTFDVNNKNLIFNISNINYNDNNLVNNNQSIENNNAIDINKAKQKQYQLDEKDIIDELIGKIKSKQQVFKKDNFKESLNKLDEEIKLGMEKLYENNHNQKIYLDNQKELLINNLYRNKKISEIMSQINENIIETKSKLYLKNGIFNDYKNINVVKPRIYLEKEKRRSLKLNKTFKNNKGYYLSSIDRKLIVNGERKNIFSNYDDIFKNIGNKYNTINNFNFEDEFHLNERRNYSINRIKKKWDYNDYIPGYKIERPNKFNKDYFKEELDKIDNLLFSKNNFKKKCKFY